MLEALVQAFLNIVTVPTNLMYLTIAVAAGLLIGAIPGLGGVVGLTLILPFVLVLPPETVLIIMIGLFGVTGTSDTLPAVLFGVPGTAAQATVLDGHPMAKRGEAKRALGAAYTASVTGGLIGAAFLLAAIPFFRPLVLSMGSPELFMMGLVGLSMIGGLAGDRPLIGLAIGLLGVLTTMIGVDPHSGMVRWTFGLLYLYDGFPFIPALLGLFAVPSMIELIGRGLPIAGEGLGRREEVGFMAGVKDAVRHWSLVVRTSVIGAFLGAIPGIGSNVVDWILYSYAKQTLKDSHMLGQGDVRGVIAPEGATNSKDGGALVPTLMFGVPGSLSMVILLAALMMMGIQTGPSMIRDRLDLVMLMVWTLALGNVIGAAFCFLFSGLIVKVANIRIHAITPFVIVAVFAAAYQATHHLGDLIVLMIFSLVGWWMTRLDWPRPPLALGIVLGPIIGKYLFISAGAFGFAWLARPSVLIIGALVLAIIVYSFLNARRVAAPVERS